MHQSIQTKNVVYCLSFHEIFDPEVSSYLLLSSATNYSKDIFFRYKFNPFALLTSCRRFICILFEEKNFFFLFYIYIDVNKFTKFYHFHFKRKKKKTNKKNETNGTISQQLKRVFWKMHIIRCCCWFLFRLLYLELIYLFVNLNKSWLIELRGEAQEEWSESENDNINNDEHKIEDIIFYTFWFLSLFVLLFSLFFFLLVLLTKFEKLTFYSWKKKKFIDFRI